MVMLEQGFHTMWSWFGCGVPTMLIAGVQQNAELKHAVEGMGTWKKRISLTGEIF